MTKVLPMIEVHGVVGHCGGRQVFLGFGAASVLCSCSFADVLNEDNGSGYQRPINAAHSLEFRRYIQQAGASTISLTLNLRQEAKKSWEMNVYNNGSAVLRIDPTAKVFAQVDCQHRLGHLTDLPISLAFMSFIGLSVEEERAVFTTINSKAKGLSGSLIDTNVASIAEDLGAESPALYIATHLADDTDSPWFNRLKKGGTTLGLKKPVSLRMMKLGAERFIRELGSQRLCTVEQATSAAKSFWRAVAIAFPAAWADPRHHFIAKGVGIYSLMSLGGELACKAMAQSQEITDLYFSTKLSGHLGTVNWGRTGPLENFNGGKGADQALHYLRMQMALSASQKEKQWPIKISY